MIEPYTVALTSCGRFDLLEQTLDSLMSRLEEPLAKVIIIEDSGNSAVETVVRKFAHKTNFEILINTPSLGQLRSIDRLYSNIDTEWIFHCEDDWEFYSDGFISDSFAILKEVDSCSMVNLRSTQCLRRPQTVPINVTSGGVRYQVLRSENEPWAGVHFNPGLRRLKDYRIIGPYADFGKWADEKRISQCYIELGYRVACLVEPKVRHLGEFRTVPDSSTIVSGNKQIRKLKKLTLKRIERLRLDLKGGNEPFAMAKHRFEKVRAEMDKWVNFD